jgi:hypothetical protein
MKKLLLLVLIIITCKVNATHVQIDFVQGSQIYVANLYPMSFNEGTATTNASINVILTNYSINHCVQADIEDIIFVDYNGTNLAGLLADLLANANVENARPTMDTGYNYSYADRLTFNLIDITNGNPISVNTNGNIVTNNEELNSIFDTYDVFQMDQQFPTSVCCLNSFKIKFNGSITLLNNALGNLSNIIEDIELVNIAFLSNPTFNKSKTSVTPNPFSDELKIESDDLITKYDLVDVAGKLIISTFSKSFFDSECKNLNTGFYVLNLTFENGLMENYKLIKN